jgi:hypothetical protein
MKTIETRVRKEAPWLNEDDIYWVVHRENKGKVKKSRQVKIT